MSIPNRRRGLVPPPPPQYEPEWENRLRLAMEHVLVPSDFTNSYPFNSPYLSSGRIEVTQISNVTGGPSNVTGDFTKTSPHDEESEVDGSHHWAMRQWRPPSYCGTAYYASPARLPESVSASPNVSGFRLDYDNLAPWSSYDAIADALASTDTKICFQALVGYSAQATLMGGAVSRVDDEMLAETKSYWQMSLADLRDGVASHALSLANYQYVSNNASGSLLPDQGILDVTSPLEAVDNPGAYCTTIRINATAADKYLYSTGIDTWAEGSLSSYGRSLLDDANASACRDTLGASSGIWGLAVGGTAADLSATGGTSQFLRQSSAGAAITVSAIAHADLGSGGGTGTKYLRDDMSWQTVSAGVTGSGTTGTIPKWSGASALTDSLLSESGTLVSAAGDIRAYRTSATPGIIVGSITTPTSSSGEGFRAVYDFTAAKATILSGKFGTGYKAIDIQCSVLTVDQSLGSGAAGFRVYSGASVTSGIAIGTHASGVSVTGGEHGLQFTYAPSTNLGTIRNALWGTAYKPIQIESSIFRIAPDGTADAYWSATGLMLGANSAPSRKLEVRSTSAQIRGSYNSTVYWERGCASDGANKWVTNSTSVGSTELEATRTITGAITDGYAAGLLLDPGYSGAYTVTRHNYLDCQDVSLAASAVLTDACLVRFDAAAGTHKATVGATTKTTPGGVDAWIKVNINGTIYYVPAYTSTTA